MEELFLAFDHPSGSRLEVGPCGPVVYTPDSAGVALDDMLCRLWQWADGRTADELESLPLFADQRMLRAKLLALRSAGLLLPALDSRPVREVKQADTPHKQDALVSVIIVSRNGWNHLDACLPSLIDQTYRNFEIILVDEQSTDGTQEQVSARYPSIKMIEQTGAPNFAAGCNIGVRHASGEWLFFLNNDTILEPVCIAELMAAQDGQARVGGVAAMMRFYGNRPFVNSLGSYVPPLGHGHDMAIGNLDLGQFDDLHETPLLCFGAALVSRQAIEQVGLLDEAYGFYYEDADWSYRARAAGYRLLLAPKARVYHKFGGSMNGLPSAFKTRLVTRNRLRFAAKNLPPSVAARKTIASAVEDAANAGRWLDTRQVALASATLRGWWEFAAGASRLVWQRTRQTRQHAHAVDLASIAAQFPKPQMQGPYPRLTEEVIEKQYCTYLHHLGQPDMRSKRLLIISPDIVQSNMGGVGMRYWELAGQLAQVAQVTLATPARSDLESSAFAVKTYRQGQGATLIPLVDDADIVLLSGFIIYHHPFLHTITKPIIVDLYDPTVLENLALFADKPLTEQDGPHNTGVITYNELLNLGDFFICASEKQRDFWLGALTSANRVNPASYAADPTLRRLIDVVPFGLPSTPPQHTRQVLKGIVPGIGDHDKVILWGGGIWDWLDPLTAIEAMPKVLAAVPEARLFFMGIRHPNPNVPPSRMAIKAIERAEALGLRNRSVFFNDWVPYAERANYLLEADLGLSLHGDHIETRFAVRTRLMDCLWAGLPMVVNGGDTLSDLVRNRALGAVVTSGDVKGVAEALIQLLKNPIDRNRFKPVAETFCWPRVAEPLMAYVRDPWQSATHTPLPATTATAPTPVSGLLSKAYAALRRRGIDGLGHDVRSYLMWRLSGAGR